MWRNGQKSCHIFIFPHPQINVAVLVTEHTALADFIEPIDVFQHANMFNGGRYHLFTVGATTDSVSFAGTPLTVPVSYSVDDLHAVVPDVVVIPGECGFIIEMCCVLVCF